VCVPGGEAYGSPVTEHRSDPPPIEVLVASGGSLFRQSLRSALQASPGVTAVGEAASEAEVVSGVTRAQPDVIVLDASLPPNGGQECTSAILAVAPSCRVVLLAEDDPSAALVDTFESGASGLLPKTATLDELLDAIHVVCRGGVVVPSHMLSDLIQGLVARRGEGQRARASIERLTGRERQVLALLSDGADNVAIADALVISPLTARTHVQNVMRKLRVHSRLEAAMFVARFGLGDEPLLRGRPLRRVQ